MICAFSTSSPQASVALIGPEGEVLGSGEELAPRAASGACLRLLEGLLQSTGMRLNEVSLFVSDLGPGSFTGVKVGVTLAKTLALSVSRQAAGVSSFDLINPLEAVVLPSKRGEWFVRRPGQEPARGAELPEGVFFGYGPGIEEPSYPHAKRFADLITRLEPVEPEFLVPKYLMEPAISVPKQPYRVNS